MLNGTQNQKEIWAIGGGKGGTGKTFVICQLALHLASMGKRVILIDADFGGANAHFFFGIRKTDKTLIDFFEKKQPLESLITETKIRNLGIIVGNQSPLSASGIRHFQKLKFFRHIKELDADYILLDLGAGTAYHTIDVFLQSDRMITVTVPEIISIDNLFHFIKNAYFRKLQHSFARHGIKETARNLWQNRESYGIKTIQDLIEQITQVRGDLDDVVVSDLIYFPVCLVLNKIRNPSDVLEGFSIKSICIKYLGVNALYSGYLEHDNQFWKNISLMPSKNFSVSPRITKEIISIAQNIRSGNQLKIDRIKIQNA
jgi:flagellar biosynthesis protein FlhG